MKYVRRQGSETVLEIDDRKLRDLIKRMGSEIRGRKKEMKDCFRSGNFYDAIRAQSDVLSMQHKITDMHIALAFLRGKVHRHDHDAETQEKYVHDSLHGFWQNLGLVYGTGPKPETMVCATI